MGFADRVTWLTTRRSLGAAANRRASIGLGSILLAVCALAIVGSRQLHSAVSSNERASTAADLYQDARYYSTTEDAERATYSLDRTAQARAAHDGAASALQTTLLQIQTDHGGRAGSEVVTALLADHRRYRVLAAQEFRLVDAGRVPEAAQLERTVIDQVSDGLISDLSGLEEERHRSAVNELRSAHRAGVLLAVGAPVVLGLAMTLLVAFMVVTRGYGRTMRHHAMHDALTGLPNRLLFADRVQHALAASGRSGARPVVMVLDLDRFKEVNDTLGHHFGDQLLIDVAGRLSGSLRPGDTVARLGGDEFAVLLPDGGAEDGALVATRLISSLETPFTLDEIAVGVEVSIGIATAEPDAGGIPGPDPSGWVQQLMHQADTAMYTAKTERTGFSSYIPGQDDATPGRLALLGELRQAFDRNELVLHYQPKVAVDTGELLGVEALVRWLHPKRGLLAPAEFLKLAEETTLIHRLTSRVLELALGLSRQWLDRGMALPVSVNISARSLLDGKFPANVADHLTAAGVPATMLCLELTESSLISDPDKALAILGELHRMGVRLSIDDFGTGYSSMAYLKILPVDELKVDRSFVRDMAIDPSDAVLVQSTVDLGHNLGLSVVAEGVEDGATLAALKKIGTDVVQGYYLGRPMAADKLDGWLANHLAVAEAGALPADMQGRTRE
jgi:diguanylate cyclase (GGDEF)-like protein